MPFLHVTISESATKPYDKDARGGSVVAVSAADLQLAPDDFTKQILIPSATVVLEMAKDVYAGHK